MFGTIGGDEEPRHFLYRGFSLLCKPQKLVVIKHLIDKYEEILKLRTLDKSKDGVCVLISWEKVPKILVQEPRLWQLLFALGIMSHVQNGNVEIRPNKDILFRMKSSPNESVYFTSTFHAKMCLVTVFANYQGRHLYRYNEKCEVIEHEEIW